MMVLLTDEEWQRWGNREVAKRCAVDEKLVRTMRTELSAVKPQIDNRLVERDGTIYEQNTANIGAKPLEVRASSEPSPVVGRRP